MCTVSGCHLLTVVVSSAVGLSEYLLELYQKEFEHGFCESSYVFSVFLLLTYCSRFVKKLLLAYIPLSSSTKSAATKGCRLKVVFCQEKTF